MFQSYNKSIFNIALFDENPFTCKYEKENRRAEGFQILHSYVVFWVFLFVCYFDTAITVVSTPSPCKPYAGSKYVLVLP